MKKRSTSPIIRAMQIKTTTNFHLIPVRMVRINQSTNNSIFPFLKTEVDIMDLRSFFFSKMGIQGYKFVSRYCFSSILQIVICCVITFCQFEMFFYFSLNFLFDFLFRIVLFSCLIFRCFPGFDFYELLFLVIEHNLHNLNPFQYIQIHCMGLIWSTLINITRAFRENVYFTVDG